MREKVWVVEKWNKETTGWEYLAAFKHEALAKEYVRELCKEYPTLQFAYRWVL